jgi:hypothetical protein
MKHKNLIDSHKTAKNSVPDPLPSGTQFQNPSKQEKFLTWAAERRRQQQLTNLKTLVSKGRNKPVADNLIPPTRFEPSKFSDHLTRLNLNWLDFQTTFSYIPQNYRFTREDYKRYWLWCAGATVEEIANIVGYSVEPIHRWQKSIERKISHNKYPADWIREQCQKLPTFSGTESPVTLGTITADEYTGRFDKVREITRLKKQVESCSDPTELEEISKKLFEMITE